MVRYNPYAYEVHEDPYPNPAAAGHVVEAEGIGVDDGGLDLRIVDAQLLGHHLAHGGARAADIRRSHRQRRRAVVLDIEGDAGFAVPVEPVAAGDAAALAGLERRLVMVVGLRRLEGLNVADGSELGAVGHLAALDGRVLEPEIDGVHADPPGELVHHAFDREARHRRARRAIGRRLGPVGDHIVAHHQDMGDVVTGIRPARRGTSRCHSGPPHETNLCPRNRVRYKPA